MQSRKVFELSGGRLCLDFINTVEKRPTSLRCELLETYADLAAWSRQSGILTAREEEAVVKRARKTPLRAAKTLERARLLREALFALFSRGGDSGLQALRDALPAAYRTPVLPSAPPYRLRWEDDPGALDRMLGSVVRSAVELLTSEELDRVRVCGAGNWEWLFLDESKSRSRQWCDMAVCGNRAKARRFYQRKRGLKRRGSRASRR
ncbi:MAG TPA: ABATE domain-containing protein, partial [Vicinamibacteria bacterium]|nr:ABATE domain-containing protein [Vicinamibacteria bacterium]